MCACRSVSCCGVGAGRRIKRFGIKRLRAGQGPHRAPRAPAAAMRGRSLPGAPRRLALHAAAPTRFVPTATATFRRHTGRSCHDIVRRVQKFTQLYKSGHFLHCHGCNNTVRHEHVGMKHQHANGQASLGRASSPPPTNWHAESAPRPAQPCRSISSVLSRRRAPPLSPHAGARRGPGAGRHSRGAGGRRGRGRRALRPPPRCPSAPPRPAPSTACDPPAVRYTRALRQRRPHELDRY